MICAKFAADSPTECVNMSSLATTKRKSPSSTMVEFRQIDRDGYVLRFRIVFTHASNSSMRCIRSVGEANGVPFSGGERPEEYTHARLGNHRFPVILWQSLYGLDLSCSDPHPARPSDFGSSGRLAPFGYRALPAPAGRVRTGFGSWAFSTWSG